MLSYLNIINKAHYHNAEYSIITSFLEKQFYQGSSILDIGFGKGKYLALAKALGFETYGIDINDQYVNDGLKNGHICYHFIEQIPNNQQFDLIILIHLIEHLEPNQVVNLIKAAMKHLKQNGVILIASPLLGDRFYYDLTHIRPYFPQSIWHVFGSNKEELSIQRRDLAKLELTDIYYIKDSYRIRNSRNYYIKSNNNIKFNFLRIINYLLALLYLLSNKKIGKKASWMGYYKKTVANV